MSSVAPDNSSELAQYSKPELLVTTEWLAEHHPQVACEIHHGGQPLYPYYVGIE